MIDLHSHSTCSDGSESPERVVELAADAGCTAIALTDHDGLDGIGAARQCAEKRGIAFIAGCEVSCAFSPGTMHVLCYFVEPGGGVLQDELVRLQLDREKRNERLIERLRDLGLSISFDEVVAEAKGKTIGRPHFAAVLLRNGAVDSIQEAFDRYLAKGAPAYIGKARVVPTDVIRQTIDSGGVSVLAHPLSLGLDPHELDHTIGELADAGLEGIECYYGRYDTDTRKDLVALARRHDLVATGGSDFHGTYKPDLSMGTGTGDLCVPDEVIDELRQRRPSGIGSPHQN